MRLPLRIHTGKTKYNRFMYNVVLSKLVSLLKLMAHFTPFSLYLVYDLKNIYVCSFLCMSLVGCMRVYIDIYVCVCMFVSS